MMADAAEIERLKDKALEMRKRLLRLTHESGGLHIGGDFSLTEIMTVLFESYLRVDPSRPEWRERDRFLLSKGHGAGALYISMANRGFFDVEEIYRTYGKLGTAFGMHPCRNHLPGVETSTGSLGHGLSVTVGMSLAARLDGARHRIVTVVGDGELNEGSVWEAVMAAAHFKLGNLLMVVDKNTMSLDGPVAEVMGVDPLDRKFEAFGWNTVNVDGHDVSALFDALAAVPSTDSDRPTVLVAHTVKGKGIGFMENQAAWHFNSIGADLLESCIDELDARREADRKVAA